MILGISCYFHDSAVAVIDEQGLIRYALHEERFSRIKHDSSFPRHCLLELRRRGLESVSDVIYFEKPFLKFDRNVEIVARRWPRSFSIAKNIFSNFRRQLQISQIIKDELRSVGIEFSGKPRFSEHHLSHIASAFFESGFTEATGITLDGVGESECGAIYKLTREDSQVSIEKVFSLGYPNSIGLLYSAFTAFLGFKVNSGEYKVMGLAPYGVPRFTDLIEQNCLKSKSDWSSFGLNMEYFDFEGGQRSTTSKFAKLFECAARDPSQPITKFHADIAASIQNVTQKLVVSYVQFAAERAPSANLVYAGGVALNCVANTEIERAGAFENIFVQPAAGDAGGALGAAFLGFYFPRHQYSANLSKDSVPPILKQGPFLGFDYSDSEVLHAIDDFNLSARELDDEDLIAAIAEGISENKVFGLFRGRSEFGPRALGNRSIIANATVGGNISRINNLIKYREGFRPFAPMLLRSDFLKYFQQSEVCVDRSAMLFVAYLREQYRGAHISESIGPGEPLRPLETNSIFPSAVHLDYSARVQVIEDDADTFTSRLLHKVKERIGYGILINTSFNLRGEPNVEGPSDAISTYLRTNLDFLILNNYLIEGRTFKASPYYGAIHDPD